MKYIKWSLVCIVLIIHALVVKAQYNYQSFHFTQQNGLPQNSVNDMYWDSTGYLWISTEAGLSRYDGYKFYTFSTLNNELITSDRFRWINKDIRGRLFVASADGKVFQIVAKYIEPTDYFYQQGYSFIKGTLPGKKQTTELLKNITSLYRKNRWTFNPSLFHYVYNENGDAMALGKYCIYLTKNNNNVDSICVDDILNGLFKLGNQYYAYNKSSIYLINPLQKSVTPVLGLDALNSFTGVYPQADHSSVIVNASGVICQIKIPVNATVFSPIMLTSINDIRDDQISNIAYLESASVLAVGSFINGLYIYKKSPFKTQSLDNPEHKRFGYYAHVALNDSTVVNHYGDALTFNNNKKSDFMLRKAGHQNLLFHKGVLYSSSNDTIYYQKQNENRGFINTNDNRRIFAILPFGDTVYVLNRSSLFTLYNQRINETFQYNLFDTTTFANDEELTAAFFNGGLWISFNNAIYELELDRKKLNKRFDYRHVRSLTGYQDMLFGTSYGDGIFVVVNNTLKKLGLDKDRHLMRAHHITVVKNKWVYISTNNGLFCTTLDEIKEYINERSSYIHYHQFNEEDGLENSEFNGGALPSGNYLGNGELTFSNMRGIVFVNENLTRQQMSIPAYVHLHQVIADNQVVSFGDSVVLNKDVEQVVFEPSYLYWYNADNIHVRYKLEGFNTDWQEPKDAHHISYTNLPAGTYTLYVEARTGFNPSSIQTLVVTVIKEPKYHETWWFKLLMVLLVISLIYLVVKIYYRRLLNKNLELEVKVAERTSELKEANTELTKKTRDLTESIEVKSKLITVISHDIIAPLKFINLVAKKQAANPDTETGEIIHEIRHTSQKLFENAQNTLNWIQVQNNQIRVTPVNLSPYALVEEIVELLSDIASSKSNQLINRVSMDDVIRTDKNMLQIILGNIISNAVKYCQKSSITIEAETKPGTYRIVIKDNGPGISEELLKQMEEIKLKRHKAVINNAEGTGMGFIIIYEMARMLQAEISITSKMGEGTTVSISLPF